MGVLFEYFSAPDDETAATALDVVGGPSKGSFDAVFTKGIDPAVQMGKLEELLTRRPYEEISEDPRAAGLVRSEADGEQLVLTLPGSLMTALAAADRARLAEVAVQWSQTEEFGGDVELEALTEFLVDLSNLARRAAARRHRLYCWVCV